MMKGMHLKTCDAIADLEYDILDELTEGYEGMPFDKTNLMPTPHFYGVGINIILLTHNILPIRNREYKLLPEALAFQKTIGSLRIGKQELE